MCWHHQGCKHQHEEDVFSRKLEAREAIGDQWHRYKLANRTEHNHVGAVPHEPPQGEFAESFLVISPLRIAWQPLHRKCKDLSW